MARFFERLGGARPGDPLRPPRHRDVRPHAAAPATLEEQVDDVRAVMDAAGAERADLIAIMEGGPMAMLFAASAPERVRSLTLYAAFARSDPRRRLPGSPGRARSARRAMGAMVDDWGDGRRSPRASPPPTPTTPACATGSAGCSGWRSAPARRAAAMELNGRLDVRHVLGTIRVPTLLLHRTRRRGHRRRATRATSPSTSRARGCVELDGARHAAVPRRHATRSSARSRSSSPATAAPPEHDRVLATVLFTDIVGSTDARRGARRRARGATCSREHDRIVRACARAPPRARDQVGRRRLPGRCSTARRARSAPRASIVADVDGARARGPRRPAHRRGARSSATTSAGSRSTSPRG